MGTRALLSSLFLYASVAVGQADPFADPQIKPIQDLHERGIRGDKEAVVNLIQELEQETREHPENKLFQAYLGSAYTLRSRDVFPGPSKWKFLQQGIKTMDDAVTDAPDNLAVRFIRAMNNYQLPAVFNRREVARNDFVVLLRALDTPGTAQDLNIETQQAIYYYAGLVFRQQSNLASARTAWSDGVRLAPDSTLGEKITLELNKIKS